MRSLTLRAVVAVTASLCAFAGNSYAQTAMAPMTQPVTQPMAQPAPHPMATMNAARATAPGSMIDSEGGGAIPALPLEVQSMGGISFINGGVGDEELAQLKAQANNYNLRVLLTAPQGEFISGATMRIMDSSGRALATIDDAGPYVYAHLPPGKYSMEATDMNGQKKSMSFTITGAKVVKQHIELGEGGGITTTHRPTAKVD